MIVLPLLPKTSLHAGRCLGSDHRARLGAALAAMARHPAYERRHGHDHVILFNYWDAWGVFGGRGSASHMQLTNVSLGWHETQDASWGMANHRHVGKCQIALPYVETAWCARQPTAALTTAPRPAPLFFSGAVDDFDTERGSAACPNVARHAISIRAALLSLRNRSATGPLAGSTLRRMPHNMRACNGSAACEGTLKQEAARAFGASQLCAVAAGDTPSTGRLYDALSCLCVPLLVTDDIQLPFGFAAKSASALLQAQRLPESELLSDALTAVTKRLAVRQQTWGRLQADLLTARRQMAYRRSDSVVASLALKELWSSCIQRQESSARPLERVARC